MVIKTWDQTTPLNARHRRDVEPDSRPDVPCDRKPSSSTCPRHCPAAYAESMARHAADSITGHIVRLAKAADMSETLIPLDWSGSPNMLMAEPLSPMLDWRYEGGLDMRMVDRDDDR